MNKLFSIEYDGASGLTHFKREHNSKAYHVTTSSWIRFFGVYGKYMTRREIRFSGAWNWVWPIGGRVCPSCFGAGVLHAEGYPTIGCPKCWGEGEI